MPVLHNAALGPHAGYHATRAACRLPVPHACTLLDMAGVRSTRSTCPPRVLRCPANLAYKLPHEMQVPARGVRPPSFKYILLYLGGWILRRPEAPPAPVQAFEGEREVSGTLHARNLRGARGFSVVTGCSACVARGPLPAWEPWSWRCTPGSSLPPPLQGRPKAAQRQNGHAAAPNASGGTEGEPNGRNFRPPGVAFLEGCAVLHGPLLRGGCFARRSQATSCGACCRYTSQARALGAGPTGPMGEREREGER